MRMDASDEDVDDLETMSAVVEAARARYSSMLDRDFQTPTVMSGQPEFMHTLVFQ